MKYNDIKVWNYSRWSVNKFLGKISIPLQRIANGNINRNDVVIMQTDRKGEYFNLKHYLLKVQVSVEFIIRSISKRSETLTSHFLIGEFQIS